MDLPDKLATDGFVIIPGFISRELIAPAVEAVKERVKVALSCYNIKPGKDFKGLIDAVPMFHQTPDEWPGKRFGPVNKRGWMKASGTGHIFEDWSDPSVAAVQEACRVLAAALHQVAAESLHRVHERCSIKVPGCPEFRAHLDRGRGSTFQILVALTDTKFLLWPGSHQHDIAIDEVGFYPLKPSEIKALPQPRSEVDAVAGDVCVMVGGKLVHGSVAVTSGIRVMTYAHYEIPAAAASKAKPSTKLRRKLAKRKQGVVANSKQTGMVAKTKQKGDSAKHK